ncbi:MAG TPA: ribosome maturation factor RimM [Kiloniellales bacterium]|nr:ribosome maturation factor RimM [Kiloniellales bacterium]
MAARDRLVLLGAIASVHGVRGLVKLKAFTEREEDLVAYGPLTDARGERQFRIELKGRTGGLLLAAIEGITTREAAERLRGTELYVERDALPPAGAESWYRTDLEGLAAVTAAGEAVGRVEQVLDYGAGGVLQIRRTDGSELLLPFSDAYVPTVDVVGGTVTVVVPDESQETDLSPSRERSAK